MTKDVKPRQLLSPSGGDLSSASKLLSFFCSILAVLIFLSRLANMGIVILARGLFYIIRGHENRVKDPSNNISVPSSKRRVIKGSLSVHNIYYYIC